jgi:hypothetical protein
MIEAVDILDALQARAFEIYIADHPAKEWNKEFRSSNPTGSNDSASNMNALSPMNVPPKSEVQLGTSNAGRSPDDDLIDMDIRAYVSSFLFQTNLL